MVAEEYIKMAYGADYPKEKFQMLWMLIKEENWTKERLMRTVKYMLKNNKYPNWTIADFFSYKIELHSYEWALNENMKSQGAMSRMLKFKIKDKIFFCYPSPDAETLPFERVQ